MWSSKFFMALTSCALISCVSTEKSADNVCPVRSDAHLRALDVYDGPIAEMAILVPDEAADTEGFWSLAYVYEAGRTVNIRCKYSDNDVVDVEIKNKIEKCQYAVSSEERLILRCN